MKLKKNSMLKKIGNTYRILPLSDHNVAVDVILKTNEVGAFIYQKLEIETTKEELLKAILNEYEVTKEQALKDLDAFMNSLKEKGLLDD